MESKVRKWLYHEIPSWIEPENQTYFITICCKKRGTPYLIQPQVANAVIESLIRRKKLGAWHPFIFLIMPDHVHGIIRFGMDSKGMKSELRNWKSWLAKSQNIEWQEGFFDHRIRDENYFTEKFEYILQNPVRAGLVEQAQDWHWKIVSED